MGVTEEAGGVAKRMVGILSGAPMLLALVMVNFATFAMVTYLVASAMEFRAKERAQMFEILKECYKEAK